MVWLLTNEYTCIHLTLKKCRSQMAFSDKPISKFLTRWASRNICQTGQFWPKAMAASLTFQFGHVSNTVVLSICKFQVRLTWMTSSISSIFSKGKIQAQWLVFFMKGNVRETIYLNYILWIALYGDWRWTLLNH